MCLGSPQSHSEGRTLNAKHPLTGEQPGRSLGPCCGTSFSRRPSLAAPGGVREQQVGATTQPISGQVVKRPPAQAPAFLEGHGGIA